MMTPELQADWEASTADAGFDSDHAVLYPLRSNGSFGAMHFPPGQWPHAVDNEFAYDDDAHRQALYDLRDRHVVVVDHALEPPKRVLVLRHEAEHVAQYEASPAGAQIALRLAAALRPAEEWLYLALPHERDADAAATRLAAASGIEGSEADTVGSDRMLYAAPWEPPDPASLPLRLLAFTLFDPDAFDLACTANQFWPYVDPAVIVEQAVHGGVAARTRLRHRFDGFLDEVANHGITREQWGAMDQPARNRVKDELRTRVVEAEAAAVEDLRVILG